MPKVKKIQEEKPGDWQTIFCSLSIILVAFFVMLSSYATLEQGKIIEVRRSFRGALDIFSGGILFQKGDGIVIPSPDSYGQTQEKTAAPIYQLLKGKGLEDQISMKSTSRFIYLTVLDSVLFDEGSVNIKKESEQLLMKLGKILGSLDVPVEVEGHTAVDASGKQSLADGWQISAYRAINVMKSLKAAGGIPDAKITARGFSSFRPFIPNKSEEDRTRNRRVEIIIPLLQDYFEKRDSILRNAPPSFKVWDLK